jgi:import inner membrane translocase subunit TIM44
MSEVLTEIIKIEPTFEMNDFLKRVQYDIIPNILESLSQGELEILKDWCTEAVG